MLPVPRHAVLSALVVAVLLLFVIPAVANGPLVFKAKIGFEQHQDKIVEHTLVSDGRRLVLVGEKSIQVWDVETARLISSTQHGISQFAPARGFFERYLLLSIPKVIRWKPYLIDPDGKWIATIEKTSPDQAFRVAVIRNLESAQQVATLAIPNQSMDYIAYDDEKDEIITHGRSDRAASFLNFDRKTFRENLKLVFDDHEWHQLLSGGNRMIVGSGDSKGVGWLRLGDKQGDRLTLRDVKTGGVEKEFTAKGLLPRTPFQETTLTTDERYLISRRDDRIFVWSVNGGGQPSFEVSSGDPKVKPRLLALAGDRFLIASLEEKLAVYEISGDGRPSFEIRPKLTDERVKLAGVSADGRLIAVENGDEVSVHKVSRGGEVLFRVQRESPSERFHNVAMIDDGKYLNITRSNRSEKKADRTELYDPASGKTVVDIPFAVSNPKFTADKNLMYFTETGSANFWNFPEKRGFRLSLETETASITNYGDQTSTTGETYNTESIEISPDQRYVLRHGEDTVTVFDLATGEEVQSIFDAAKVKYDKKNKVKKSGLSNAGWAAGGRVVYAFESAGLFGTQRIVTLWTRTS